MKHPSVFFLEERQNRRNAYAFLLFMIILATCLSSCAKSHPADAVTCNNVYAGAFEETYPDGVARKSEVAACSDGCNKVTAVGDSANSFKMCGQP